jgi:GNAT superfamily N-acetyltransferase
MSPGKSDDDAELDLRFHEVTSETWGDLEKLFQARGGPSWCWCMVWRDLPPGSSRSEKKARKPALRSRVDEGVPIGFLAYRDDEPVAWCSLAPRETYRPLTSKSESSEDGERVWSLVCFYVARHLRGEGISRKLLVEAIERARAGGATVLEAYPVDLDSPSYRFMGFVGMFEYAGFHEVGRTGSRRHVYRLELEAR